MTLLLLLTAIVALLLWIGIEGHKLNRRTEYIARMLEVFDNRFERWEGEATRKLLEEVFCSAQKRSEQSE